MQCRSCTCAKSRSRQEGVALANQSHPLAAHWSIWNAPGRLFISWVWPLLRVGASRVLQADDVWPTPPNLRAEELGVRVEELWRAECALAEARSRAPRLIRGVLLPLSWRFVASFLLQSLLCGVAFFVAPILLRGFLTALQEGYDEKVLAPWGFGFAACWFTIAVSVANSRWNGIVSGCIWRVATQRLIYAACLTMPLDASISVASTINLMSVDSERFFVLWNFAFPHAFILIFVFPILLGFQLGVVPAVICMLTALAATGLQWMIGGRVSRHRARAMTAADSRMQLTEQFLEGIRVLKMSGWTDFAKRRLATARSVELQHLRRVVFLKGINLALGLSSPCAVGFSVFSSYVLLGGEMLPEVIFPALSVLRSLQLFMGGLPTNFSAFAEFSTAYQRVYRFLVTYPLPSVEDRSGMTFDGDIVVRIEGSTFVRSDTASAVHLRQFALGPVNVGLRKGDFCVVCGPVGSGKSTFLLALLSEVKPIGGLCTQHHLVGDIRYCGQEPWIQSASLRENVICLRPHDDLSYAAAVAASQLLPDIDALPGGADTEIGARGINISGGQKARIALARAIYAGKDCGVDSIFLLDDVLSAVDVHIARHLIDDVLLGSLRKSTRVLVANTFLSLLLPHADSIIILKPGGTVEFIGTPFDAFAASAWLQSIIGPAGIASASARLSGNPSNALVKGPSVVSAPSLIAPTVTLASVVGGDGSLLQAEDRAVGIMDAKAYATYFRQATSSQLLHVGILLFVIVLVLVALAELARTSTELWVTFWTQETTASDPLLHERKKNDFWISGYVILLGSLVLISVVRAAVFTWTINSISEQTHAKVVEGVLRASVPLFFDVVPTGRILNRFSKDLDSMDAQLPDAMAEFLQAVAYVFAIAMVCVAASYYCLLVILPLLLFLGYIRKFYSATSRELKRLEAISRTPLYTHFQETLSGLAHIRAFHLSGRMLDEFERRVDENMKIFIHQYSLSPWLMLRVNGLASCLIGGVVILAIVFGRNMDPSLIGLSLASGAGLLGRLHMCVQYSIETENHFVSVERLDHFKYVPQEMDQDLPYTQISGFNVEEPHAVQDRGEIVFEDVEMRYRPHLPLVLEGVSFKVLGGQHAAIVGRSGSGKSSCMLAVLRLVQLAGGRVLLDGRDVRSIPLQILRFRKVSIIPQDPYLFAGSIRSNLDPYGRASTNDCEEALRHAQLSDVLGQGGGLEAVVGGRGSNLSIGQRQLLCIARALLRKSQVVLMDEGSANIDTNTDALIQQSLRTCFKLSTLVVIAHRLSTVVDSDVIICMDGGKVVEMGPPAALSRKPGGVVAGMFCEAGQLLQENHDEIMAI